MPEYWPKRRFTRYPIVLPLLHSAKAPTASTVGVGWTSDLSGGGAGVRLAQRICPQDSLNVRVQTDCGPIQGEAQVVWAGEPDLEGSGIQHGVVFTHLPPDQLQPLRDLLVSQKSWWHPRDRLPVELPVACRLLRRTGAAVQGRTGNVSRGGLLLLLPQVLPPGTVLEVTLHTPTGPLTAAGTIIWGEPLGRRPPGKPIRHGVRFTLLPWPTSLALARFLADRR
jgi:hypothetical protein